MDTAFNVSKWCLLFQNALLRLFHTRDANANASARKFTRPTQTQAQCNRASAIEYSKMMDEVDVLVLLFFLLLGDSQQSMSFSYRIAKSTISSIVRETCSLI